MELTGLLGELKKDIEKNDKDAFLSRVPVVRTKIREMEHAVSQQNYVAVQNVAVDLGLTVAGGSIGQGIAAVQAAIKLLNAGINFFINGPDEVEVTENFLDFDYNTLETTGKETYIETDITLKVQNIVDFKGWVIGANYQKFQPKVSISVDGDKLSELEFIFKTGVIGFGQDKINITLEPKNLDGHLERQPYKRDHSIIGLGIELRTFWHFKFTDFKSVDIEPVGVPQIDYGLDGANFYIAIKGDIKKAKLKSGTDVKMELTNAKHGISI